MLNVTKNEAIVSSILEDAIIYEFNGGDKRQGSWKCKNDWCDNVMSGDHPYAIIQRFDKAQFMSCSY